ncbi:uncharacterized protein BX663DRAFT_502281 [Cokeromyces recurvatus]|uniref:uncharacterized protein n=1 Tax=Cokeromyces recurvatus TaxID=90255 RepID=UPI002221190C|nr:uncharacterized protein BX663DRAFT_502281 [Cokeromyces recurvatus]KAI7905262.1 hypothetical protein BX663DRAFT_502281 [Cokeromyces recurvatus]
MPNLTIEFRQLVEKKAITTSRKSPTKRQRNDEDTYDLFTKEAYRIYQHIDSLKRFLITIRPAYLTTSNRPSRSRPTTVEMVKASDANHHDSLFALFSGRIHNLTDHERDEIDFQAKLIIRRCMDRVKELEESEKMRQSQEPVHSRFTHFLSSILLPPSTTEDILGVHRSSMTWYLNQKLIQVSKIQKEQQEIRLARELEKSENQLSKSRFGDSHPLLDRQRLDNEQEQGQGQENLFEEEGLSQEQLQILEKENSAMLENLNNTLNQVKNAEKALLEISTLQSQLTNHLAAQTIQTDKLYADAITTTEKVEQGNLQLIKARERNKSSRKFILVFLISASFVLLFLDWYS